MARDERELPGDCYDAVADVTLEEDAGPFRVVLGSAKTIARGDDGHPRQIRVKLDLLSHGDAVLHFGQNEGLFELVLREVEADEGDQDDVEGEDARAGLDPRASGRNPRRVPRQER